MRRNLLTIIISVVMVIGLLPVTASAAAPKLITNVQIDVAAPVAGNTPDTTLKLTTSPANAAVVMGGDFAPAWTDDEGEYFTGTFKEGEVYHYYAVIQPKSGYKFDFDKDGIYTDKITADGSAARRGGVIDAVDGALMVELLFAPALSIGGQHYSKDRLNNDISGSGWKWNAEKKQLILSGYNGGRIRAYRDLDIVLADGTDNRITVPAGTEGDGIFTFFNCVISGKGDLDINMANKGYDGIWSDNGSVSIKTDGDLSIRTEDDGINTIGDVNISGSGRVAIDAGDDGIYSETGRVSISGSGDREIISGCNGITVFYGNVNIAGTGSITVKSGQIPVKLFRDGYHLELTGSGRPLSFISTGGYPAVYNVKTGGSPVAGRSIGYYNKVSGSPALTSVVYDTTSVLPFCDVSPDIWFYNDVVYAYDRGLMNGTSAETFDPNGKTSRAMIVTILYRMEGSPYVSGGNSFADVSPGMWYSDAITWANKNGIVNGYSSSSFGPDNSIIREQMAAILYRYARFKGYDVSAGRSISSFSDANAVSDYAVAPIKWAYACGLINGTSSTRLSPKDGATRAQSAAILHRFCENVK